MSQPSLSDQIELLKMENDGQTKAINGLLDRIEIYEKRIKILEDSPPIPTPKLHISDWRGLLAILVLIGYLGYIGVQALLSYLNIPDILANAISGLAAMTTLVLGFYFGVQSSQQLLAEKDARITSLEQIAFASLQNYGQFKTNLAKVLEPEVPK